MKKIIPIILVAFLLFPNILVVNAAPPNQDVTSFVLFDAASGRIMDSKNPDERCYPASTTKVMTAILAFEYGDLDREMTASEAAIMDNGFDGSNAGIEVGQKLTMRQLLEALLVASANESANIIAENIAPTRKDFIDLMNKKALDLGATNTHFTNTNGLYNPEHYTSASDMAKFAAYAMKISEFRRIVSLKSIMMPANKHNKKSYELFSTNNLLYYTDNSFIVTGIKTGFISQSGHNLVSSATNKDGMELISVIFGSQFSPLGRTDFKNSYEMLKYGYTNYSYKTLVNSGELMKSIPVIDSATGVNLDLVSSIPVSCAMPNDASKWNLVKSVTVNPNIKAPIKKGAVLGIMTITSNGLIIKKFDLVAATSVDKSFLASVRDLFGHLFGNFIINIIMVMALLLVFFVLLRFTLRRISRAKREKRYLSRF